MKRATWILTFVLAFALAHGQELQCSVDIDTRKIQSSNKTVFEKLRISLIEFMNNRHWSNYEFKSNERITVSMLITIDEAISYSEFKGSLTIASSRPVFNSNYTTTLFNYIDRDIQFTYVENEPLDFSPTSYVSELTSIMAFYANLVIGLDFESFIKDGGTPFFEQAQTIVNTTQNSPYKGWKSYEGQKNRYWLVENLTNPSYAPLRSFYYEYHRRGLDMMYDKVEEGRANAANSLKYLLEVKKVRPGIPMLQIICDSKRDEIVNIFTKGTSLEKTSVLNIMKEVDPSHVDEYQKIVGN